jgi:uncharacterized protein YfkK (UPF0435 family)
MLVNCVWKDIGGTFVILDLKGGSVLSIESNSCAGLIWKLLSIQKKLDIKDIVNKITDEYDVESDQAATDVYEFVNQLNQLGIISNRPNKGERRKFHD